MSADAAASGSGLKLTRTQWLICFIATIGFLFDIYELLMLPLVAKSALLDIAGITPGSPEFFTWVGRLFFIPAIVGGIFGLMGGWLTDRFGRRRVLTFSILLYAFAAFFAGFCVNPWQLLFFRCLVFIGVCVEFVAAVAWLAELFPDKVQREKVLGYTQAFSSVGGLSVAIVNYWLAANYMHLPEIPSLLGSISDESNQAAWRYTLMSGLIPAIPLIIIRPFLPESPQWQKKKDAGQLGRPRLRDLFTPQLKKTTIVATILFALAYGAAFGSLQQMRLIIPDTPDVKQAAMDANKSAREDNATLAAANNAKLKAEKAAGESEEADQIFAAARQKAKDDNKTGTAPDNAGAKARDEFIAKKGKAAYGKVVAISGIKASKGTEQATAAKVTKVQEVGGLFGRAIMALLIVVIIARGSTNIWAFVGWSQLAVFLVLEGIAGFSGSIDEHFIRAGKGLLFGGLAGLPIGFFCLRITEAMKGAPTGRVLRLFQLPGMIIVPLTFAFLIPHSLNAAYIGMFLCGFLVVGQFTFWGNLLPKLFPVHLRGTGESFAANIGGRLVGTSFAWVSTTIAGAAFWPETMGGPAKMAYTAAAVGGLLFVVGYIVSGHLPEPQFADHEDEPTDDNAKDSPDSNESESESSPVSAKNESASDKSDDEPDSDADSEDKSA
ncbi:MAG: MFS transporter [Verrucomicrobiales bacterium]|nr:MFS transporter [Verrucomicrobiales bacterium]